MANYSTKGKCYLEVEGMNTLFSSHLMLKWASLCFLQLKQLAKPGGFWETEDKSKCFHEGWVMLLCRVGCVFFHSLFAGLLPVENGKAVCQRLGVTWLDPLMRYINNIHRQMWSTAVSNLLCLAEHLPVTWQRAHPKVCCPGNELGRIVPIVPFLGTEAKKGLP